jgi:hypothetical protein
MANNLDTILGGENNIQDNIFELSKTYFPNVLPDTLKTGLFGYMSEIYAHGLKQNIYHSNVLYNEYFFNTASFPATIYNKVVDYDLIFSNSKPSKATIELAFKISELDNFKTDNRYLLKRNKTKFLLGEFSFLLPYDISIIIDYDDIPKVLAEYDINNCPRVNESIELLYKNNYKINSKVTNYNNEWYLYMVTDIYQLTLEEYIKEINVVRLNDQIYYDVSYTDQLVDFYTVYYSPANTTNPLKIKLLDKFISDYNIGNSVNYCFFNYLDENLYRIYFTEKGFNPKSNSKLITYTFSSKGSLGNFNYRGNIAVELEDNLTYVISIYKKGNTTYYPSGGIDRSSLLDMKRELFKSIKKVNTLNSDDDLKEYFNMLAESTFNNNSIMKFIKIQDDIVKREYGVYLTLFDDSNTPFSSNSVDIIFDNTDTFTNDIENTINVNTIIVYDPINNIYRLMDNDTEEFTDFKYRYTSPFLIKVREYADNIFRLKFYNTYLDNIYDLYLKEKTTLTTNYYLLDNIHIYRDTYLNNNDIKFTCTLDTNITLGESNIHTRLAKVKIVAVLKNLKNSILGYFTLNYIQLQSHLKNENIYGCTLTGFEDIFINDLYTLNNVLYSHTTGTLHNVNIPEDLSLELIIIDNLPSVLVSDTIVNNLGINIPNPDRVGKFPLDIIVNSKATARNEDLKTFIYNTEDAFVASYILDLDKPKFLFQSLNHIINSTVYQKNNKYIFDRIPLLSLETYRLNSRKTLFSQQIIDYSNKVYDSIKNLCNNTSINLKFFNTYGVSRLYQTHNIVESVNNAVDLSLSFTIRLNVQFSNVLENKIKTFILKYVRENISINNKELIKSNLVTAIENEFIEIKSVVFNKINNSTSILSATPLYSDDEINKVYHTIVPEYLYVGYDRNNNGTVNTPKIEIIYR